jgi:hypothetical protein
MPMRPLSKDEHLRKAQNNKAFAQSIKATDPTSIGWVLVAAFYSALHFVDAFGEKYNTHFSSHAQRNEEVQKNPQLVKLRDDYRDLCTLGWNARYTNQNYGIKEHKQALESLAVVESAIRTLL